MSDTTDLSLTAHVVKLATLREELAQRSDAIKAKRAAFEATIADDVAAQKAAQSLVEAEESAVRALAERLYADSADKSNKKLAPGVEIKVTSSVSIADKDAALAWAKASGVGYVPETFDAKVIVGLFTGAKPKMQPLPFVHVSAGVAKAQIATDLTKALADVQERAA